MAKYAKIQNNIDGKEKYSITPQIPGGYITPENLIKIGEVVVADTKANLEARVEAEYGATEGKLKIAKKAKELD